MSKRQENAQKTAELIADLIAFRSILYKMGFDELADNEKAFVEAANEIGFRTITGAELTYMGYRQMMNRADQDFIRSTITQISNDRVVYSFGAA